MMRTPLVGIVLTWFLAAAGSGQDNKPRPQNAQPASPPAAVQDPGQIIQFLSDTISWYRLLATEQQLATEPADLTYYQENNRVADQVVQLAFDYARSQAQLQTRRPTQQSQPQGSNQYQGLTQAEQKTEQDLEQTQSELAGAQRKLAAAPSAKKGALQAQIAELESETGLLEARHDALDSMLEFVSTSNRSAGGVGLRAQVEELARSVPSSLSRPAGANPNQTQTSNEPASTTNAAVVKKPQPAGIWGLGANLLQLSSKMRILDEQIASTRDLGARVNDLHKPLLDAMRGLIQQGDQLFAAADTASAAQLPQVTQQLQALTSQFKQISAELLPLSKISVLLDIYQRTLENWRLAVKHDLADAARALAFRLGVLLVLVALVFAIGEIWRRTTFRYVHDNRRRYQFLLLRRVVMWVTIAIIVIFTFASQLGSAVTFAGLITAGVAVALQNVIVSMVAYFFLIGKYGIRVGDRVQIGGVTGEVVDIGLVRIHVMELGGPSESQPTGRVVAFSNSIVFQPTGVFKQIPGTNFLWHELNLTLASETDYNEAKQRLNQAINAALEDYRENIEAQRLGMEKSLNASPAELRPKVRLHYTGSGIEATIRFPVQIEKATEMDDHIMREILAAMDREPKLKVISAEMPAVKLGG
jgi:small-conductance mechanosensitive channel